MQATDVTGDWEMTMVTQRGEMKRAVHFEQEGETLTVTMEGMKDRESRRKMREKGIFRTHLRLN